MIVCESVENSKYEQILVSLNFYYNDFGLKILPMIKLLF